MVIICDNVCELLLIERRVTGNCHARCEAGEKPETLETVGLPIAIEYLLDMYRKRLWQGRMCTRLVHGSCKYPWC